MNILNLNCIYPLIVPLPGYCESLNANASINKVCFFCHLVFLFYLSMRFISVIE